MRIYRAGDHRTMKWKNGGGETVEIATFPEGASLSDFGWRISMATVAVDGPFSIFTDVDRTLALVGGHAIRLEINGLGSFVLTQDSAPLAFPADVEVHARLEDGPITDLNVMTRRGVFRHNLKALLVTSPEVLEVSARWNFLITLDEVRIESAGVNHQLHPRDCMLAEHPATFLLSAQQGKARILAVEIDPA